jgi:hypothetical protein
MVETGDVPNSSRGLFSNGERIPRAPSCIYTREQAPRSDAIMRASELNEGEKKKKNTNGASHRRLPWLHGLRLWCYELQLRFRLFSSKRFRKYCEKNQCPHLACLEQDYIDGIQKKLSGIRKSRISLRGLKK